MENNVLYVGMADDILSPMILVPDFDCIFVMNILDRAYSPDGTWKGMKKDIISTLKNAHTEKSHHSKLVNGTSDSFRNLYANGSSEIIEEIDNGDVWIVNFKYSGKPRQLIYYYDYDFNMNWPENIRNIKHVMTFGAFSFGIIEDFMERPWEATRLKEIIEFLKSLRMCAKTPLTFYLWEQWLGFGDAEFIMIRRDNSPIHKKILLDLKFETLMDSLITLYRDDYDENDQHTIICNSFRDYEFRNKSSVRITTPSLWNPSKEIKNLLEEDMFD